MTNESLTIMNLTKEQINELSLSEANLILNETRNILYNEMPQIIEPNLKESEQRISQNMSVPFEKWEKHTYVEVDVTGMTASEYFKWQYNKMGAVTNGTDEESKKAVLEVGFPAHPEHYTVIDGAIVETLGGLPTYAGISGSKKIPEEILELKDDKFPMKSIAAIVGRNGEVWGYGLSEFRDTDHGSQYRLRVFWPQGSPQIWFDDHARHFSVEYRNFIKMAAKDLKKENIVATYNTHLGFADDVKIDEWELLAAKRAVLNLQSLIK